MNEAARFYERRKEGLGLEFLNEVQRTITSILAHPQSGPAISQNIRRRIVRRFPFGVLYANERFHTRLPSASSALRRR